LVIISRLSQEHKNLCLIKPFPCPGQLDLAVEAQHLQRFNHNFRRWRNVSFPIPLFPLVSSSVLVETFEEGRLISRDVSDSQVHMQQKQQQQQQISQVVSSSCDALAAEVSCEVPDRGSKRRVLLAETGLNLYLQMLLKDNFCHADLHPGNIIVREESSAVLPVKSTWGSTLVRFLSNLFHVEVTEPPPRLVLLDAGMIAELQPSDQGNLVNFFKALTRQEGEKIGRAILTLSERHTCKV
jgi:aarF domain-containing kinase